jgi:hypothetical protein
MAPGVEAWYTSPMAPLGPPYWGGSRNVVNSIGPKRLALAHFAWISSRKRPPTHPLSKANPGSDHNMANEGADAIDFATFSGEKLAHAIARKLGIVGYKTGNFDSYTIHVRGATFRVQLLWGVANHWNHVHLGVKLIAGSYQLPPKRPTIKPRRKSYGRHGRVLKRRLRRRGHKGLNITNGYYRPGQNAVKAVRALQKRNGLKADGIVGPKTWKILGE